MLQQIQVFGSRDFELEFNNLSARPTMQLKPPAAQSGVVYLAIPYAILLLFGLATNLRVSYVVSRVLHHANNTPAISVRYQRNILVYILALCSCNVVVLSFISVLLSDLVSGYWILNSTLLCRLYLFTESLNKFFGPFLLASLSGMCCLRICRPSASLVSRGIQCDYNKDIMVALLTIGACVLSVILLTAPVVAYSDVIYIVVYNGSTADYYFNKCVFNPSEKVFNVYIVYSFLMGYVVPALLFTYFYGAIMVFIRRRSRSVIGHREACFWRVAKTALGLVLFYLFCWTPYWSMTLYHFLAHEPESGSMTFVYFGYAIHSLPYINCAGYPVIYTILNRDIKSAYHKIVERQRNQKFTKYVPVIKVSTV